MSTEDLENTFSRKQACAFSSQQAAITACLELLGTRANIIPVVMCVTSPPDTLSAALRAGGHPLLLDVDPQTLQMDPEQLEMVIKDLDTPIVVLNPPGGADIDPRILDLVQDLPTILDSRVPLRPKQESRCQAVFNVFDMALHAGGPASIVMHKFEPQVTQLKLVRSGIMGLSADLHPSIAKAILSSIREESSSVKDAFEDALSSHGMSLMVKPNHEPSRLFIRVPNARKVVAHLTSFGIDAVVGIFPLCQLEEVKIRYKEPPDYPGAESLDNQVVAILYKSDAQLTIEETIKEIKEVS